MWLLAVSGCLFLTKDDRAALHDQDGDGLDSREFGGADCDDDKARIHGPTFLYEDRDGDGYGDGTTGLERCDDGRVAYVTDGTDCDDDDASVGAEGDWYRDTDGDGYGDVGFWSLCPDDSHPAEHAGDCDDSDAAVHPGATDDACDGVDADCDGTAVCGLGRGAVRIDGAGGRFGSALSAVGGLDDRGDLLAVGAPGASDAYLFAPDTDGDWGSASSPVIAVHGAAKAWEAGSAVLVADVLGEGEGPGTPALVVGAPGATPDGATGEVFLLSLDGIDPEHTRGNEVDLDAETPGFWEADGGQGMGAAIGFGQDVEWGPTLFVGAPQAEGCGVRLVSGLLDFATDLADIGLGGACFLVDDPAEALGSAVLPLEFGSDGHVDVAIGAPGAYDGQGAVRYRYGPHGTTVARTDMWEIRGAYDGDAAGSALASADTDGDGLDDVLVVGAPGGADGAGDVYLVSLDAGDVRLDGADALEGPAGGSAGAALATLTIGGAPWLAVGAPNAGGGTVYLVPLDPLPSPGLLADHPTLGLCDEAECGVGSALAVGDFDGDGADDLAIAATHLAEGRGAVFLLDAATLEGAVE